MCGKWQIQQILRHGKAFLRETQGISGLNLHLLWLRIEAYGIPNSKPKGWSSCFSRKMDIQSLACGNSRRHRRLGSAPEHSHGFLRRFCARESHDTKMCVYIYICIYIYIHHLFVLDSVFSYWMCMYDFAGSIFIATCHSLWLTLNL